MEFQKALGLAIRNIRKDQNLTQEAITAFSSRSYLSEVENGKNEASIAKVNEIAGLIGVHPLTILTQAYLNINEALNAEDLQKLVLSELRDIHQTKVSTK